IFKETIPALNHFDGFFISSDWGCLKPEPVVFQKFFDHFNINPEESYFIDDLAENIGAASDQGMKGHVFDGDIESLLSAFGNNDIKY
ncbi:HAD-IA family hydrolase, partial [Salinicoccus sp. YB14-2]|uniref:HAD-IA family hydrolase n=1 Tax=Salinicoccus sp. YB14-2 TaxID=1572701 RepID=UPI0018D18067